MSRAPIVPDLGQRCVVIDDLRLRFFIGVHEHERKARQEVSITIHMFVAETGRAAFGRSGRLRLLCGYRRRAEGAGGVHAAHQAGGDPGGGGGGAGLADARVASVVVDVRKTEIIPEAKGVGVIIHRQRGRARRGARPMPVDVSVIMPAYQAGATIARAAQSVFAQTGVTAELVLCADDELDYGVPAAGRAARHGAS